MREAISALPAGSKLDIASPGEIRATSLRIFDRTFAVTYGLEAAAVALGWALMVLRLGRMQQQLAGAKSGSTSPQPKSN